MGLSQDPNSYFGPQMVFFKHNESETPPAQHILMRGNLQLSDNRHQMYPNSFLAKFM